MRTELNCPFGTTAPQPNTMFEILAEDLGTGLDKTAEEIEFDSAQFKALTGRLLRRYGAQRQGDQKHPDPV